MAGNRRGAWKRNEDREWKDEASEVEEGRKRARERGESWGWRTASMEENETRGRGKRGEGRALSARGRGFKRNQFRVAVQSNVTPAAAGVNVDRNSNFTPGPR